MVNSTLPVKQSHPYPYHCIYRYKDKDDYVPFEEAARQSILNTFLQDWHKTDAKPCKPFYYLVSDSFMSIG